MPEGPSEPEQYSIDDMMDRLKGKTSTDPSKGELVTRADGTQAIKVRSRKRRSDQPVKQDLERNRKTRIIQVTAAVLLLMLSLLTALGFLIYGNSRPFYEALLQKIQGTTGATTQLRDFRINPKTANAGNLTLNWPEGNFLKDLSILVPVAQIRPITFLGKTFNGEEVTAPYGLLHLQFPQADQPRTSFPLNAQASPIQFDSFRVQKLDAQLGSPDDLFFKLTESEASLTLSAVNGRQQLSLYKGKLTIPGLTDLRLNRALIELTASQADIIDLSLCREKDELGTLSFKGSVGFYSPNQASTLAVSLESFDIIGIAGPDLGQIITGRVDTLSAAKSNYVSFFPSEDPKLKLDVAFQVAKNASIQIHGLPFLSNLSKMLNHPWFDQPIFDTQASGVIHHESGLATLQDLNLVSKNHMTLRGRISTDGSQALGGSLRVGIAASIISTSNIPRLKAIFSAEQDGFCWIDLKLGGTPANPTDNFSDLYTSIVEPSATTSETAAPAGSDFEELTQPRK